MSQDHPRRDCQCPRARHVHGTLGAYQYDGCRCFACRLARSRAHTAYAHGGTWREADWGTAIGVARRLQALTAIGYTDRALAPMLGMHPSYVVRLRAGIGQRVTDETRRLVVDLYDQLWDRPYDGPYSVRTTRLAAAKGWLPPLAWDDDTIDEPDINSSRDNHAPAELDEIAIERAMRGDRVPLNKAEKSEAIRRLVAMRLTDTEIARRLHMTTDAVLKRRHRAMIASRVTTAERWHAA